MLRRSQSLLTSFRDVYGETFKADKVYYTLINYTNEFLSNIKVGLQFIYNTNTANKKTNKSLNIFIAS
jgi:hypothetical protein